MPVFPGSILDGNEGRGESQPPRPKRRLDSTEHYFRGKCVPGKSSGNKFWS
jgi:hypothetical protein